uniref:Uncharacterized protein n=1 Tax=Bos indicus x Bos taurus TaxID=30522 RepID=A0A4W2E9S5_BOBOX
MAFSGAGMTAAASANEAPQIPDNIGRLASGMAGQKFEHIEPLCGTRSFQKQPPICDHHKTCPDGGRSLIQMAPSLPCLTSFLC